MYMDDSLTSNHDTGLHCLCSVIPRDEASPPTGGVLDQEREKPGGAQVLILDPEAFEVVRNLNNLSCPCERFFFERVGYLG